MVIVMVMFNCLLREATTGVAYSRSPAVHLSVVRTGDGSQSASLLLGADGYRSQVREQLEEWDGSKGRYEVKPLGRVDFVALDVS